MQRTYTAFILTLLPSIAAGQGGGSNRSPGTPPDIEITGLTAVRVGAPARLCPGPDNTVRVVVEARGLTVRAIPLRLSLVLPDGPPNGTLVAEGSVSVASGHASTFTFLHVEVPVRLRGRGAKLIARANADQLIPEQDLANDARQLDVDAATDWRCRR